MPAKGAVAAAVDRDASIDEAEITRFESVAAEWWDSDGKFRPLHRMNPTRVGYIRDALCRHFGRTAGDASPLRGLAIADVGCGGGLLCEPMARLGATVTGIDATAASSSTREWLVVRATRTSTHRDKLIATSLADSRVPMPIWSCARKIACPPSWVMPASKVT